MTLDEAGALPFREEAEIALQLSAGGAVVRARPGAVTALALHLLPHGLEGWVELREDLDHGADGKLHDLLVGTELVRLELTVQVAERDLPGEGRPEVLRVQGVVTARAFTESTPAAVAGRPVLQRRYRLAFADPAAALWGAHHPTVVRPGATIAAVVEDLGAVAGVELRVEWDDLARQEVLVCLGLGDGETSFWDYVVWLAASRGGSFTLDHASGKYRLAGAKPREAAPARALAADLFVDLERVRTTFPPAPRHAVRIADALARAGSLETLANPRAVEGLFRDVVVRAGTPEERDAVKAREARRSRAPGPELTLPLRRYPGAPVRPGDRVKLAGPGTAGRFAEGAELRVLELALSARSTAPQLDAAPGAAAAALELRMAVRLERADDPVPRLPQHAPPRWPVLAEAVVTVDAGADGERVYAIARDSQTAREYTEVTVAPWGERIRVPFQPGFVPGHVYAPPFKGQAVLVALHHDRAELVAHLDWADGVRLPAEGQGNHVLLGKSEKAETSIRHQFVEDLPTLSVTRRADKDRESLALADGVIVLETHEEREGE